MRRLRWQGLARQRRSTARQPGFDGLEARQLLAVSSGSLTLTQAAINAGYSLTTFASGFPSRSDGLGPFGVAFPSTGGVLVTDDGPAGDMRFFPSDTDGQDANSITPVIYGQLNIGGLAELGGVIYMTGEHSNDVVALNNDGTTNRVVATNIPDANGITPDPLTGHLFVSEYDGSIVDVDPATGEATVFADVNADGLDFDPTTNVLYVALYSGAGETSDEIEGFNAATKAVVFNSGNVAGMPDGITLGTGVLAGNLFANTNAGTVIEINLATGAQTVIASGGTRGDFVEVDPNNDTLLISQADRLARLAPPAGGGFVTAPGGGSQQATTPDLKLAGTAQATVTLGQNVNEVLTVTNTSKTAAAGVTIIDTLPEGATFVSATGGAVPANGAITLAIGSLAAGASTSVTVVFTPTAVGGLTNQAVVSDSVSDPTPADNTISLVTMVNASASAPVVTTVDRLGFHARPTRLVISFSEPVDAVWAREPGNYQIVEITGPGAGRHVRVGSAIYSASAGTVTVKPVRRLNLHDLFRLTVLGSRAGDVTAGAGKSLDGAGGEVPTTNVVMIVSARDLVLTTTNPKIVREYRQIVSNQAPLLATADQRRRGGGSV